MRYEFQAGLPEGWPVLVTQALGLFVYWGLCWFFAAMQASLGVLGGCSLAVRAWASHCPAASPVAGVQALVYRDLVCSVAVESSQSRD